MTIAISGSGGFIGKSLKKYFEGLGYTVVRIPRPLLLAPSSIHHLFREQKPDVIIHAGTYGNHYHHSFHEEVLNANIMAAYYLMQAAVHFKAKFIYFSSSSTNPNMLTTLYSASKVAGEQLVQAFVNHHNLHAMVARPSSVTGPGEQDHHLIPTLINSCITGKEMPFVADPVHDYVDIHDVCRAVHQVIRNGQKGKTYNIASGLGYDNEEVKHIVEQFVGKKANTVLFNSLRSYDNKNWVVDNRSMVELGWKPEFNLMGSIERMLSN